jgi:hypothetical protein
MYSKMHRVYKLACAHRAHKLLVAVHHRMRQQISRLRETLAAHCTDVFVCTVRVVLHRMSPESCLAAKRLYAHGAAQFGFLRLRVARVLPLNMCHHVLFLPEHMATHWAGIPSRVKVQALVAQHVTAQCERVLTHAAGIGLRAASLAPRDVVAQLIAGRKLLRALYARVRAYVEMTALNMAQKCCGNREGIAAQFAEVRAQTVGVHSARVFGKGGAETVCLATDVTHVGTLGRVEKLVRAQTMLAVKRTPARHACQLIGGAVVNALNV